MEEIIQRSDTIASDRIEGTAIFDTAGERIGHVTKLMIDKSSGKVTDAIVSVGGFLGLGGEYHSLPWEKLDYDSTLHGYRLDVTEQQLRDAPRFVEADEARLYDKDYRSSVYEYWAVTPYWY